MARPGNPRTGSPEPWQRRTEPRSAFRGLWFATAPAAVLWGIVAAVVWFLWTNVPAGWWVA